MTEAKESTAAEPTVSEEEGEEEGEANPAKDNDDPFSDYETVVACLRKAGPLPPPPGCTRAPSYVEEDTTVARTSFGVPVVFDRTSAVMVGSEQQLMDLIKHKRVLVMDTATGTILKNYKGVEMPSLDAMVAYRMTRQKLRQQQQQQQQQQQPQQR